MKLLKALAAISFFSMLTRLLGFGLRIYMSRELGATGMGVYQVAFSAFIVLLTFVTSGIPLVVSRESAKHIGMSNRKSMYSGVSAALLIGTVTSIFISVAVVAFPQIFGRLLGEESFKTLIMLLPAVISSGIYAAFHGALWGEKRYLLASFNEFLEQVTRILICVMLFRFSGLDKIVAAGLSLSAACIISMLIGIFLYFYYGGKLASPRKAIAPLLRSSVPITGIRLAGSVVNSAIAVLLPLRLMAGGMTNDEALAALGCMMGMVFPLLFLPNTFIGALASILVPELSGLRNDKAQMRRKIESSISFSIIVSAIFVPSLIGAGSPIGVFVYDNAEAGRLLCFSGILMLPIAIEQITSSMMNSLDLEIVGFVNYLIGAAVLVICVLVLTPLMGIYAYILGIGLDLSLAGVLDIIAIKRKTGISLAFCKQLVVSSALIIPATALCLSLYRLLGGLPEELNLAISCLASIAAMTLLCACFNLFDISALRVRKKSGKGYAPVRKVAR